MKLRNIFMGALAALVALVSCDQLENPGNADLGFPSLSLSALSLEFGSDADTKSFSLVANRAWAMEALPAGYDWVEVTPKSGEASVAPQTITVAVKANDAENAYDREVTLKFTLNGADTKTIKVTQEGAQGSVSSLVIFSNNFDAEEAEKTYGSSGNSYPYLDQFDGWLNAEGFTIEDYFYAGTSIRSNQDSFTYAEEGFAGSGVNNVFFGKNAYFGVKNLPLNGATDIEISFAGQKNASNDAAQLFDVNEFHVYVSADGEKWVELDYTFAGTQGTKWNKATALFAVPEGTETISVGLTPDVASVYRIDDLVVASSLSDASVTVDFSTGVEMNWGVVAPPSTDDIKNLTVAEFNEKPVSTSDWYRLTGKVGGPINAEYGNFDLIDETGKVYVYGISNWADYKAVVAEGDILVVVGQRGDYNGKIEVLEGYIESRTQGDGTVPDTPDTPDTPAIEKPTQLTTVTVAEFLQKEVNTTDWYQLTGTIISIEKETYGNFTIQDETGSVYVYGLTSEWIGTSNDQSFAQIGLKVGDTVTFGTMRAEYNGNPQAGGSVIAAYYISHVAGVVEEVAGIELNFPSGNQASISSYSGSFDVVLGNNSWTLTSFNNNKNGWAYVKCGHKSTAYVATIATKTPIAAKVSKVTVTVDKLLNAEYVNSASLVVASDADFANVLETVNVTIKAGILDYVIAAPVANAYYKLVYDCAAGDGKNNGNIQISKVFYQTAE